MSDHCSCLRRLGCCRRESQHAYIYLYSPNMPPTSSSSSSSHWCLVCILFGLCLAFIVILSAMVIYYLNSNILMPMSGTDVDSTSTAIAQKLKLPDFVNINIDPCDYFYNFVCDKLRPKKPFERPINNEDQSERRWTQIRYQFHDQIMSNSNNQSTVNTNDQISSIFHWYQLCENQSPEFLINELERYFANLRENEPYRSYLTLFNQSKTNESNYFPSLISLSSNPFFQIRKLSSNASLILRTDRRPLPLLSSISFNFTTFNQTALNELIQFDEDYSNLLSQENDLIEVYQREYHLDSLRVKRILTFSNYHQCLSSIKSNTSTGLDKLIQLLNHFLHSRLHNFDRPSINKQIRILDKITDNHTLINDLERIRTDLITIEQILLSNTSKNSCIINLLNYLLDKRIQSHELILFNNISSNEEYFISDDWPFVMMIYDRLLKKTSMNTLINFAFADSYRRFLYPYYQPHLQYQENNIHVNHRRDFIGYTYRRNYPDFSCRIHTCFDIFNCYHPSLFNRLITHPNQTLIDGLRNSIENLIERFRSLTEQSDHLFSNEKKQILDRLNQIHIQIGHYSSREFNTSLPKFSTYIEYVQFYSSIPYDQSERSYYTEPIYYPSNYTLFLPFGFVSSSFNNSLEYPIVKLLLKIIRSTIQSQPYHIECSLRSVEDDHEIFNDSRILSHDENLVYLLTRSKFLLEREIVLDEYLWPFMSANALMKRFLIEYTATNFCRNDDGYDRFRNNTYFLDDIHLIFRCQQASSIKQSKCTVN